MLDPNGVKTAVESMGGAGSSVPGSAPAAQLDMLCEDGTGQPPAEKGPPGPRGGGRPPGSMNKSTKDWQQFLLSRYSSPLVGLAEIVAMSPQALAKQLGFNGDKVPFKDAVEMLKLQIACMNTLAPYVHQKMPTAIEAPEGGLMQLVINTAAAAPEGDQPGPFAMKFLKVESEENQGVIEADFTNSVAAHLNADEKTEAEQGDSGENPADYVSGGDSA